MRYRVVVVALSSAAACATGSKLDQPADARGSVDSAGSDDGSDQGSGSGSGSGHGSGSNPDPSEIPLLLSEVSLSSAGHEFIEIVNPTGFAVPLGHVYLSDNGNYWKLPVNGNPITSGDFIVRFPDNDIVQAHGVITVAIGTSADFATAFGANPTYSIADANLTVVAQSSPSLTDTGEAIALFYWNGTTPTVRDVDMVIAGAPTSGNTIVSKSGVAQGSGTYATDANTIAAQGSAPGSGKSTKRILLEVGHETQVGGGNGFSGDDETSEQTGITWDTTYSAPDPGQVPSGLLQ